LDELVRTRRCRKNEAASVLGLLAPQHREDLARAPEPAARYRAFSWSAVERILAAQARSRSLRKSLQAEAQEQLEEVLRLTPLSAPSTAEYRPVLEETAMGGEREDQDNQLRGECLSHCVTLGIPVEPASLDELLSGAEKKPLAPSVSRSAARAQVGARRERGVARRIRQPALRSIKPLEAPNWQCNPKAFDRVQIEELATGDFIRRRTTLILVGWSGVGKSHIIQALDQSACVPGYCVLYGTSDELLSDLSDLTTSLTGKTLPARLRRYANPDLVIIDEFGFDRIERTEGPQAAHLFQ
jgi:DNA replication protein DnaC